MQEDKHLNTHLQEKHFLNTFPLVRRIALRSLGGYCQDAVDDIAQKVMLKLLVWKNRRSDRYLSDEEWQKLANTTTQNVLKTFYADNNRRQKREVSLSEISETHQGADSKELMGTLTRVEIEGNTQIELRSLLVNMWKSIADQSLREKYALLLKGRKLLNRLIAHKCCNIKEAADVLELTKEEFIEIYRSLPLRNADIAVLLERKLDGEMMTEEKVIKARQRARARIRKDLAAHKNSNGKAPIKGKT